MSKNAAPNVASGGEPPYDNDMDRRLTVLETRFDTILPTLATKLDIEALRSDMLKMHNDLLKWIIGFSITIFVAVIGFDVAVFNAIHQLAAAYRSIPGTPARAAPPAVPSR
jgi:hypothetical protein